MACDSIRTSGNAWAGKPYPEIVETARSDGSILVLPVGSVEQHGHHLPVSTDTILVDAVAHLGAERVAGDVPILVAPPVWSGYSPHHMSFGGTFTLDFRTLLSVVEQLAAAGLENGFDALLLLNGHGGNAPLINAAVSTIGTTHPEAEVLGTTYFRLSEGFIDEIRESDVGGMAHGGEFETSLMQHLRPELVGEGDGTYLEEPYERAVQDLLAGGSVSVYREFDAYSTNGAVGDASLASAEKGEAIYTLLGDELEELLRTIHERNG